MIAALLVSSTVGLAPFLVPPPNNQSTTGTAITGAGGCVGTDSVLADNNGYSGCQKLSDVAPQGIMLRAQPAFAAGTQTASDVVIAPGQDETLCAIDGADPSASCAGDNDTITVTVVNSSGTSTATILTEGTNWTASASVADTCASLATAVAALAGVGASCTSPNVLITIDADTAEVTLAESTAGCTTVGTGTSGWVKVMGKGIKVPTGAAGVPTISDINAPTTGLSFNNSRLNLTQGGVAIVVVTSTGMSTNGSMALATGGKLELQPSTISPAGAATTFAVSRALHTLDCDAGGNTIATITGGTSGNFLVLKFVDASCTITDTDANTTDTVNLSAAFTSSDTDTLTLIFNGTKWFEVARAVN